MKNDSRRKDWQENHSKIVGTYVELLRKRKTAPTLQEVVDAMGGEFSMQTVWSHINDMDLSEHVNVTGVKALTKDVLLGIANAARKGSSSNAKLFMQVVHGWSEKTETDLNVNELPRLEVEVVEPNEGK